MMSFRRVQASFSAKSACERPPERRTRCKKRYLTPDDSYSILSQHRSGAPQRVAVNTDSQKAGLQARTHGSCMAAWTVVHNPWHNRRTGLDGRSPRGRSACSADASPCCPSSIATGHHERITPITLSCVRSRGERRCGALPRPLRRQRWPWWSAGHGPVSAARGCAACPSSPPMRGAREGAHL